LGFAIKEFNLFSALLLNLCDSINKLREHDPNDTLIKYKHIEYITMPFFANHLIIAIMENKEKWTHKYKIYYALAQCIYTAFGAIKDKMMKNEKI